MFSWFVMWYLMPLGVSNVANKSMYIFCMIELGSSFGRGIERLGKTGMGDNANEWINKIIVVAVESYGFANALTVV